MIKIHDRFQDHGRQSSFYFYDDNFPPFGRNADGLVHPVVFLCFTDFGIPASVGGKFEVIASVLYSQMLGSVPDFHKGSVVAVMMLLPSIVSIALLRYLENTMCAIRKYP